MIDLAILATEWFDGERLHPVQATILIAGDRIRAVLPGRQPSDARQVVETGFAAPGLVEGHCHLFLDGATTDLGQRQAHLSAGDSAWLATGRANLRRMRAAGITLVRDAGDKWGINHRLRAEAVPGTGLPRVRSPGAAIRRKGRYGGFMATEVETIADLDRELAARGNVDDLKIVLTGIIDFAKAQVVGSLQFNLDELSHLTAGAAGLHGGGRGVPTFVHCSGSDGIDLTIAAGVGSIEHGFFMTETQVARLAERGVAWCPTWSPVAVMGDRPELLNLDGNSVAGIRRILDNHRRMLGLAAHWGVAVVAGSDAGSCGVVHGAALHDELAALSAAGFTLDQVLAAATSVPRRAWGAPGIRLEPGAPADLGLWATSPRHGLDHLRQAQGTVVAGIWWHPAQADALASVG